MCSWWVPRRRAAAIRQHDCTAVGGVKAPTRPRRTQKPRRAHFPTVLRHELTTANSDGVRPLQVLNATSLTMLSTLSTTGNTAEGVDDESISAIYGAADDVSRLASACPRPPHLSCEPRRQLPG